MSQTQSEPFLEGQPINGRHANHFLFPTIISMSYSLIALRGECKLRRPWRFLRR